MKKLFVLALIVSSLAAAGQVAQPPTTSADEVMAQVFVRDRQREKIGQGYTGYRLYILDNEKWHKHAELLVRVKSDTDGSKHFEVVNEQGWQSANKRVLRKMLESEAETSSPIMRPKVLLTPNNYSFDLVQTDSIEGRPTYVIDVTPKRRDKYLFEGRIWIDGLDFALVRCEGNPARNPSFWTRSIHFVHQYQKNDEFWFPYTTDSVTDARIFGKTNVAIHYFDYVSNTGSPSSATPSQNTLVNEANYVSNH